MNAQNVKVLVSLSGSPSPRQIDEIGRQIRHLDGVNAVQPSVRSERMLFVDYDPNAIPARQILGVVRGGGFDARLVGM